MSGMNVAEAEAYAQYVAAVGGDTEGLPPYRPLPLQALDHAAGYFLAFGIAAALMCPASCPKIDRNHVFIEKRKQKLQSNLVSVLRRSLASKSLNFY